MNFQKRNEKRKQKQKEERNKIDCSIMYSRSSNEFKQNPRNRKNKETKNSKAKYKKW